MFCTNTSNRLRNFILLSLFISPNLIAAVEIWHWNGHYASGYTSSATSACQKAVEDYNKYTSWSYPSGRVVYIFSQLGASGLDPELRIISKIKG